MIAAPTSAMPPIVGVPAFAACGWVNGPSSRMSWPIPRDFRIRIRNGVPTSVTANATDAAMSSEITGPPR